MSVTPYYLYRCTEFSVVKIMATRWISGSVLSPPSKKGVSLDLG